MALDFLAGCVGGCAGVVVGHPFDTIKVRLQTQDFKNPQYKGTLHCLTTTIKNESVRGLYKGMTSPMAGVAVVNAIVFGVYGNIQRRLPDPTSYSTHFIAGASAGFCQAFICSPIELVKTRIQLQSEQKIYKSPFDCLKKIWRMEGITGVFRGLGITIAREVPAFGTYFLSYELMTKSSTSDAPPLSALHILLAGGMAGTASWVLTYPIDVVKSRLQVDGMTGVNKYTGVVDCVTKSINAEGYGFLTRGLMSTVLRAFPTNAACFTVVTWVFRLAGTEENTSSQYISDFTETRSLYLNEPKLPVNVGTFLQGFEKQEPYFSRIFKWKNVFLTDINASCSVNSFSMSGTRKISNYMYNGHDIFSDFSQMFSVPSFQEPQDKQMQIVLASRHDAVPHMVEITHTAVEGDALEDSVLETGDIYYIDEENIILCIDR